MSTPTQRFHVDHEMSQALCIARELALQNGRAACVNRAMRVAYAAHFRVLMEFFHDGRPDRNRDRRDLAVSDFTPPSSTRKPWSTRERKRFEAADKLVGHLSKGRARRHNARREWGGPDDDTMIRQHIRDLFAAQPRAPNWFPLTAALLA